MEIDLVLVEINFNLQNDERKINNSIFWPEQYLGALEIKILLFLPFLEFTKQIIWKQHAPWAWPCER